MKKCFFCQADMDDSAKFCSTCGKEQPLNAEQPEGNEQPFQAQPAFANPFYEEQLPWYERYWNTVKAVLLKPTEFFTSFNKTDDISKTIMYFLVLVGIASFFNALWNLLTNSFMNSIMYNLAQLDTGNTDMGINALFAGMSFIPMVITSVIGGFIGLFVGAGIIHVMLLILGEGKNGFNATLNAIIFSYTPNLIIIIPIFGSMISWIWVLVLNIISIKHMQDTTWGKAVAAVLLPGAICCCLAVIIGIAFSGLIAGLAGR